MFLSAISLIYLEQEVNNTGKRKKFPLIVGKIFSSFLDEETPKT